MNPSAQATFPHTRARGSRLTRGVLKTLARAEQNGPPYDAPVRSELLGLNREHARAHEKSVTSRSLLHP